MTQKIIIILALVVGIATGFCAGMYGNHSIVEPAVAIAALAFIVLGLYAARQRPFWVKAVVVLAGTLVWVYSMDSQFVSWQNAHHHRIARLIFQIVILSLLLSLVFWGRLFQPNTAQSSSDK